MQRIRYGVFFLSAICIIFLVANLQLISVEKIRKGLSIWPFNTDETHNIVLRRSVYLFLLPTSSINQVTHMLLLNYYIPNQLDHSQQFLFYKDNDQANSIVKAIYVYVPIKIPLQYVSLSFLLNFLESHQVLDPRNTHEEKSGTHKIPTKEIVKPTKNRREKLLEP